MSSKKIVTVISLLLSTYVMIAQCAESVNVWNNSWTSCTTTESPNALRGNAHWLLYEFDEPQVIDSLHIWNANKTGESQLGVQNLIVDYSVDGDNWVQMADDYVIPQADESDNYEGYDGVALGLSLIHI